jgi:Protein of unknown function (DUF2806)
MNDDKVQNQTVAIPEEPTSSVLTTVVDAVTDLVSETTIPAPIRKNLLKAFNQLCIAAIDIPVAHLEGIASEKRAETSARLNIINTSGKQIAKKIDASPEFSNIAIRKYGQKILREQVNLNNISEIAAIEIKKDNTPLESDKAATNQIPEISDDWLNSFEKEACLKSTEEMQQIFGRILAGEIRKPTSFSIKTVKLIGQLDSRVVNLFNTICSLSVSLTFSNFQDIRVVSIAGNANLNKLSQFGLSFDDLNILHEYGLIIPEYNSNMDYAHSFLKNGTVYVPFKYQNSYWTLKNINETLFPEKLELSGVALSNVGRELFKIVNIESNNTYTTALTDFFKSKNLEMIKLHTAILDE